MIVIKKHLEYKYGQEIKIRPLFDIHYGAKACNVKQFGKYLSDADENTFFIGGGDLLDSIHVTDPRYRKSQDASGSDDSVIDNQIDRMLGLLEPYKDKIISLGTGNHEDCIIRKSGTNPIKRICKELNIPFMGYSGAIRLSLSQNGSRGRVIIIRVHHGWGDGSRSPGSDLNKYYRDLNFWDADIYLYGHTHRRLIDEVPRMQIIGESIVKKPRLLCICGTFLETLSDNDTPTYSEIKGYPMLSTGGVELAIKPTTSSFITTARHC